MFYSVLLSLRIVFIVTWVGVDSGVFLSSFWIRNPKLSTETRLQFGRLAGLMDMGPRTSLIGILGVGLLLAYYGGWAFQWLPVWAVWLIVVLLALWLWAVWQQFFAVHAVQAGHQIGRRMVYLRQFRSFDLVLRLSLAVVLIGLGIAGVLRLAGAESFGWLNTKLVLFGVILLNGAAIRMVSDDFPIALGEIVRLGSTPERERRLNTALLRAYPFVVALWLIILVMLFLGVAKPF